MKKVFVLILMLWICVRPVHAKTYYGQYGEYSDFKEEAISSTDTVSVQKNDFYHVYKENINYEYLDESQYEKTGKFNMEYSSWTEDSSILDQKSEIEKCVEYKYKTFKEMKYFYFTNSSGTVHIDNMTISDNKSGKILMTNSDFMMYQNDTLIFNIDEYNLANLVMDIVVDKRNVKDLYMKLSISDDKNIFSSNKITIKVMEESSNNKIVTLNISSFDNLDMVLNAEEKISICDTNIKGMIIEEKNIYRNIFKKYEYKVITKEYKDIYSDVSLEGYKLDYTDYKTYYRYKIRDKVVLSDNLSIDNKQIDLKKFVLESTTKNIEITSNLNLNINGLYNINFILPFKTVSEEIRVDIKENYIDAIKASNEYINYLLEVAETANYSTNKKNEEIKEMIIDNTTEVNSLKEEINNNQIKLKQSKEKQNIEEKKQVNKQSINLFLVLLGLSVIFMANRIFEIRKKRKAND